MYKLVNLNLHTCKVDTSARAVLVHESFADIAERNRPVDQFEVARVVRELVDHVAGELGQSEQARISRHSPQQVNRDTRVHLLAHIALDTLFAFQSHPRGSSRH